MSSSERIKEVRAKLGLTQEQLGDILCVQQCAISNYEIGRRRISVKMCYKIIKLAKAKGWNISLEYLMPEE